MDLRDFRRDIFAIQLKVIKKPHMRTMHVPGWLKIVEGRR